MINILSTLAKKAAEATADALNIPLFTQTPTVETPKSTLKRSPKGVASLPLLAKRNLGRRDLSSLFTLPKGVRDLASLDREGVRLDSLPTKRASLKR